MDIRVRVSYPVGTDTTITASKVTAVHAHPGNAKCASHVLACAIGSNQPVFETLEKTGSFVDKFDTKETASSSTVAGPIEAQSQRDSLPKKQKNAFLHPRQLHARRHSLSALSTEFD